MKTVSRGNTGLVRALFLVGALAGVYFYRRQGGKVAPLIGAGVGALRRFSSSHDTSSMGAREISSTPESMDNIAAR